MVIVTGRPGGDKRAIHTDPDCHNLDGAKNTYRKPRSKIPDDAPECSTCAGEVEYDHSDPYETRRRLRNTDPEDLGLSRIGERPGQSQDDLVTDGGTRAHSRSERVDVECLDPDCGLETTLHRMGALSRAQGHALREDHVVRVGDDRVGKQGVIDDG